jgi:hypothetical protein
MRYEVPDTMLGTVSGTGVAVLGRLPLHVVGNPETARGWARMM